MKNKSILLSLLLLLQFVSSPAFSSSFDLINKTTVMPLGQIINLAGKNRFNSQRMGKAYILLASGHKTPAIEKELAISINLIEENLRLISDNAPSNKVKDDVKLVSNLWEIYKGIAMKSPSIEGVAQILAGNTQFLDACNQLVLSLVEYADTVKKVSTSYSNKEVAQCINLSGRFRMLSQRLSLYHIAYYEGHTPEIKSIISCISEINSNIGILLASSVNDTEVDENLSDLIMVWKEIREKEKELLAKNINSMDVNEWGSKMLAVAEKLTKAYDKLLY